ncbi:helix-turn-helix domain-containing protein [Corynebacterium sp.]|uniref:helix-turn-helix domain-containing protein n=1 Tax=Corynebacterium sp. TaxID=1720 RepID=UPI0026DC45B7|nr:helix-turn-helix domain-containing protein [Corynebacterium sp.]MDO5032310.1 helix-turn-helix domain-containing protein [Corynebacterium sp.]
MAQRTITTVMQLATEIRTRRKELGLTQSELGARIGRSRKWISDLESGKTTVELLPVLDALGALNLELTVDVGKGGDAHDATVGSQPAQRLRRRPPRPTIRGAKAKNSEPEHSGAERSEPGPS